MAFTSWSSKSFEWIRILIWKIDEINELIENALFNDAFYIYSKYKIYNLYCAKLTLDEIILMFENFWNSIQLAYIPNKHIMINMNTKK